MRNLRKLAEHGRDGDVLSVDGGSPVTCWDLDDPPRGVATLWMGGATHNIPVEDATQRAILEVNAPKAVCIGVSDHSLALVVFVCLFGSASAQ